MIEQDKTKWVQIRTRLKKGLENMRDKIHEDLPLKQDMRTCFAIHKRTFGKPKTAPSITCCIDVAIWLLMVKNLNKDYNTKADE